MSQVTNTPIPVTGPQGMQPLDQTEGPGVQQPVVAQPPPLRTPQEVLAESQQRFPQANEKQLRGESGIPTLTGTQMDTLYELAAQKGPQGMATVLLETGGSLKVALMPTEGVPGPDQTANIQGYVREGQALYERIMGGDMEVPRGKDEVAKIMWFLQALGSSKASESSGGNPPVPALFKEGAFSIEDPEHRLEGFLASCNSYKRESSHLSGFQGQPGCHPRGVDIRGVPMPNGRKTVLFARMPGSTEVAKNGDPNMGDKGFLFLKIEPHGCRGFSFGGTGRAGEQAGLGKSVKRFFANLADSIGHAFGFTRSLGQRIGLVAIDGQNNRERVPSDVKELYTGFTKQISALQKNGSEEVRKAGQDLANLLARNAPLSSTGGIRVMIQNLEQAKTLYLGLPQELRDDPALASLGQRLDDALLMLRNHGDHAQYRIGNEVILMSGDTGISNATRVERPDHQITRQGGLSDENKGLVLAGMRYILSNIDNKKDVVQFEKDSLRSAYRLGMNGDEHPVTHDVELAKQTVLDLADGDQRIADSLMTIANQSIAEPLTSAMVKEGIMSSLSMISPGSVDNYQISRLPDTPQGAKVFRVGYSFDQPVGTNGKLPTLGGMIDVDQEQTRVSGQMFMQITFHPNGSIEPVFDGEPSFSFTLTPARK
ncbi:MAG: hypothetical protein FWF99_05085 [Desulfovibrionaceae bacterium]|nr:hypothetical protein [Desulfovibrionaceae bacterium]